MRYAGFGQVAVLFGAQLAMAAEPIEVDSVLLNVLQEARVPARHEGTLSEVLVQEGQLVSQGESLARIDDQRAQLALDRSRLELEVAALKMRSDFDLRTAEEEHRVAANNLHRANESKERFERSISAAEFDRYQMESKRTAIDIERSRMEQSVLKLLRGMRQNDVDLAQQDLERHRITAPIQGMVVDLKKRRGEWVEPGEQVLRLVRVDRLRADGYITAKQVVGKLTGRAVTLTVDSSRFRGEVVFVSPEINPVDGKVRIWAAIDNRGLSLKPGMRASMTIGDR